MKRFACFLCLCALLWPLTVRALSLSSTASILMDADTGEVVCADRERQKMLIASTTKVMTALVVLEHTSLDDTVEITASHMVEGSSMYLKPGERVTVEELLYGLLLCSGNDAALALADACGGLDTFVGLMNEKAAELGMVDSHFENPNGLDGKEHYSTAYDMALLMAAAESEPTFRRICATKTAKIGQRTMTNHNKLLTQLDGCIGGKTGYTKAAGRTLVSCCEREGRRLVAVTLCDGNDWADHAALYDYGFTKEGNE